MTGLETAIILIAFVVIAAVFGYAILSAGLFATDRERETVYSGLNQAQSNMELSGSVIARSSNGVSVSHIIFTVRNAIAGNPIDMTSCDGTPQAVNKCVISLTTEDSYINNVKWTRAVIGTANDNNLIETGEQFEITINIDDLGDGKILNSGISANSKISIQVKPSEGSTITIMRRLPPAIEPVMDLY